ncbi:nucleolar complex protein 2 homolog isoform X4 [Mytilus californianus]|uniref:nucleolar complex protein 2 homolog isoform X2 n=1 Tax=Mytilus californianus TaxID=6549 RepID=UPI00224808DE|nr:nucleolar complex protein 2 homolog isoform X2 [Mytilus californianus]XP_052081774.1 nucleolar complex protein 2 homolog isoform X4 [Mytilus californianus]
MAASMKKSMSSKKRKMEELSVDEFMLGDFDSDSDNEDTAVHQKQKQKKRKNEGLKKKEKQMKDSTSKQQKKLHEASVKQKQTKITDLKNTSKTKKTSKTHMQSLEALKEKDPEFYEFLKEEGKDLLAFDESDDEDVSSGDEDQDDDNEVQDDASDEDYDDIPTSSDEEGDLHKPPEELEVASDVSMSDEEEEEEEGGVENDQEEKDTDKPRKKEKKNKGILVTSKMIKDWSDNVQKTPSPNVLKEMISAFRAAVHQAGSELESSKYRVEGSAVYNSVIRMCLTLIPPALLKHLGLPPLTDLQKPTLPSKSNTKWKKIRLEVKSYLTAVLQLLSEITETSMVNVMVKHVFKLVAYYVTFPKLAKALLKKMTNLWSSAEETTRVVAFLCINRQVMISQESMLEPCIKQMYIAYVKNCKFTSPTTLPLINFMQRSLVEILTIDTVLGYQYAFIYIRQLAIHLRNAITVKKKENVQAVYNWQYIHCLALWVRLMSATYPSDVLQPLIYPLTQTIIGTIKLTPTTRYFPLRFHCIKMMNTLSESTNTFIPVLPFLLEVFELTDFNKKHKSISFKPLNFACILKLSKAQLVEKSFKDGIIDQLYELFMDHFNIHAHKIGFPELVLPSILQMKEFLKKCKIANYCKQIKQIVDKVQETSKFITDRRKSVSFSISDDKAITAWEQQCKNIGTPLSKYFSTWRKLRDRELQYQIAAKEQGLSKAEANIPIIERPKGVQKATAAEKEEFSALFESDSDDSDDDTTRFLPKAERPGKVKGDNSDENYSDFDSDDLDQLAKSASEDDEDESDNEDDQDDDEDDEDQDDDEDDDDDIDENSEDKDEGSEDMSDDFDDKEDIVKEFTMSDSD